MRLALLSPLPPDPSRLAHDAAQFRRALNLGGIDVLTPLVGQRPLDSLAAARAWVAERDWRGVDVVHAELAPGQRTAYRVLQALASLPERPALTATIHAPPTLLREPLHAPFAGLYHTPWLPLAGRQVSGWLAAPFTRSADRRLARNLSGLLCPHEEGVDRLARRLGFPRERITVLPSPLPEGLRTPSPPGSLKLLCLSGPGQALRPLQDLLAALSELQTRHAESLPPWQITLAGATAASCFAPPRRDPLTRLQGDPCVRTLEGHIKWQLDPDPQDLPALVAAHHLVIVPERPTPWGPDGVEPGHGSPQSAIRLAHLAGRPLLLAQQAGHADAIALGNGASYPDRNLDALVTLLHEVCTDPDRLAGWHSQAQVLTAQRQVGQMSARYVGFFQQVLRKHRRGGTK